uniref:Uncharacterized protein n=1 Tax=Myoviridae sp. ct6aW5 TaxID=2825036 RepID=A0A8S5PFG7_9CAUD|nr:MAG TPA: hypothetical protein [Myoviridae sp. ct6aW5]DAK91687.1 MAG TPA: hypothetical protein [Caudoviricetes sp.]
MQKTLIKHSFLRENLHYLVENITFSINYF